MTTPRQANGNDRPRASPGAPMLGSGERPAWSSYAQAVLFIVLATCASFVLFPYVDLANIIMVYLLAVVVASARLGHGPSVVATVLGVATFVYIFVPHYYSFVLSDLRYLPTFTVMLCVGLLVATLNGRLRAEAVATHERELRSQALYHLSRGLAAADSRASLAEVVETNVLAVFGCRVLLFERRGDSLVPISSRPDAPATPTTVADAERELRHLVTAGLGPEPRLVGDSLYLPMLVVNQVVGLFSCQGVNRVLMQRLPNVHLLEAFANNAASALQRIVVAEEASTKQQRIDEEQMRNVLLSSMSHDFRTPLASITGAVTTLIDGDAQIDAVTRGDLMESIREDADRLERQVRNMLDITRLESGRLQIRRELHPIDEVVGGAMTRVEQQLVDRPVTVTIAPDAPLVAIDAQLVEQALVNLLENAARHTPAGSPIEVEVAVAAGRVAIQVRDRGPGVPSESLDRIFEKFYRAPRSVGRPGSGLGLAICRAIAVLHGGAAYAENRPGGGLVCHLELESPTGSIPGAASGGGDQEVA